MALTNEQAKQEAIKKAYGNHYSICKPDSSGWGEAINVDIEKYDVRGGYGLRPKSLRGIEDNNGWIRIEPDGSNLPTDGLHKVCHLYHDKKYGGEYSKSEVANYYKNAYISHYKPIKEEPKPIY